MIASSYFTAKNIWAQSISGANISGETILAQSISGANISGETVLAQNFTGQNISGGNVLAQNFTGGNVWIQRYFYPPQLSFQERTGLFSGYLTTGLTPYDGLMVFQTGTSGQALFIVQSGIWKNSSLV